MNAHVRRFATLMSLLAIACGQGAEDHGPRGPQGERDDDAPAADLVSITLKAATQEQTSALEGLGARRDALTADEGPCRLGEHSGYCITPSNMAGQVAAIWLTQEGGGPPHRILGGSMNLGLDREGRFEVTPFDFAHPEPLQGEPALTEITPDARLVSLGMNLAELDLQAHVVPGETWNLKLAFVTQPLTEEPELAACFASHPQYGEEVAANTVLHAGLRPRRGDVLLCKKPSPTDVCAASDYRYIDADSGALSTTRPATPLSFAEVLDPPHCGTTDGHADIDAYGHNLAAALTTPITLWSAYERCYQRFYTSAETSGTKMDVELAFDTRGYLFLRGLQTLEGASEAELLAALVPQSILWDQRHPMGHGDTSLDVTATITLSDVEVDCGGNDDGGKRGVDPSEIDRDIDDDGRYTCADFCHERMSCGGDEPEGCSPLCAAVEGVNEAGACTERFSTVLTCMKREATCAEACETEDAAWSACMQAYCADHGDDAGCRAIAVVMNGSED